MISHPRPGFPDLREPDRLASVICVRSRDRTTLMANPNFLYVGRKCAGWPDSPFGNPFRIDSSPIAAAIMLAAVQGCSPPAVSVEFRGRLDAAKAVECFGIWLRARRDLMERLPSLRGKTLGCWCGDWRPGEPEICCHAVTLAKLANELDVGSPHPIEGADR